MISSRLQNSFDIAKKDDIWYFPLVCIDTILDLWTNALIFVQIIDDTILIEEKQREKRMCSSLDNKLTDHDNERTEKRIFMLD